MKVIKNLQKCKQKLRKPVLTIGMFDGVHLAHQRIIQNVVQQAKISKGTSIVLTFTPHPLKVLKRYCASPLITSLRHRINLIRQMNVDICLLLDFNHKFASISAEDFIKDILVNALKINYLIIGKGFCFGKNKTGDLSLLRKLSRFYGFKVRQVNSVKVNGEIISSSRIRQLIYKGKITQANKFLGRTFSILGKVKKGSAQGRILGYPTANIAPEQEVIPERGVYAVLVKVNQQILSGILNIGFRPTFRFEKNPSVIIEVHIFNFHREIYGKDIEIFFIQRIRSERKFFSPQALLAQIKKDERKAKKILRKKKPSLSFT